MNLPGFRQLNHGALQPVPITGPLPIQNATIGQLLRVIQEKRLAPVWGPLQSFAVRDLSPSLGGPAPKGRRSSPAAIECAFAFLDQQPIQRLEKMGVVLEARFETMALEAEKRSKARFYLKYLVAVAVELGLLQSGERQIYYELKSQKKTRLYPTDIPLVQGRRGRMDGFALGLFEADYVYGPKGDSTVEQASGPSQSTWLTAFRATPKLFSVLYWVSAFEARPPCYLANKEFEQDLAACMEFWWKYLNHRIPTIGKDIGTILRLSGWYLQYQTSALGQDSRQGLLAELRLTTLIPFVKVKLERGHYIDATGKRDRQAFLLATAEAQEALEEVTEELLERLEQFLNSGTLSPGGAVTLMGAPINVAKFLYWKETRKFKAKRGFEDIYLIEALRARRAALDQQLRASKATVIAREKRMVTWPRLLEAVEKLRAEAELVYRYHVRHTRKLQSGKTPIEKIKRTDRARATDYQQFLIPALLTAMPPNRAGVYIKLEIGSTFLQGAYRDGLFIPAAQLPDPAQATWWFHLLPEDYKTGEIYGEWWAELPNTIFSDGKTLYQYLDEWLQRWRLVFRPKHNYLFTEQKGEPLDGSNFAAIVARAICRFTQVRVNPHSFRHIYVTYLKSIGATEEVLESAAAAMLHSRLAQSSIYNLLDLQSTLQPSLALTKRIADDFYANWRAS